MRTRCAVSMLAMVATAACGSSKNEKPCKRSATLAARRVDNGAPFSKAMYASAQSGGEIGGEIDQWEAEPTNENGLPIGQMHETDYYVKAASRDALEKFVAAGQPVPADREIGYARFVERTRGSDPRDLWRTYLLMKESPISADVISDVTLGTNPLSNEPQLAFTLNDAGKQAFASFTKANVGKKVAFLADGEVLMAPIINSQISGGKFTMPVTAKTEADALMAKLACAK